MATKARNANTRTASSKAASSPLYLPRDVYKASIDGLRAQGLEHADAVDTLKVGLRQANGYPVPLGLLPANHFSAAGAAMAA